MYLQRDQDFHRHTLIFFVQGVRGKGRGRTRRRDRSASGSKATSKVAEVQGETADQANGSGEVIADQSSRRRRQRNKPAKRVATKPVDSQATGGFIDSYMMSQRRLADNL